MWFSSLVWNFRPTLHTLHRVLEGSWEFFQPVNMCFVDMEHSPWSLLWWGAPQIWVQLRHGSIISLVVVSHLRCPKQKCQNAKCWSIMQEFHMEQITQDRKSCLDKKIKHCMYFQIVCVHGRFITEKLHDRLEETGSKVLFSRSQSPFTPLDGDKGFGLLFLHC